eukprot:637301-Ditylum_brightwellii.AAC.1
MHHHQSKAQKQRVIKCFVMAIVEEGKAVMEIEIDEDGAIGRSATFTNMIVDELPDIRITTTGGYASWMNGKAKRPHKHSRMLPEPHSWMPTKKNSTGAVHILI